MKGLLPRKEIGCPFVIEARGNRINFTQPLCLPCSMLWFISSPTLYEKRQQATKRGCYCNFVLHIAISSVLIVFFSARRSRFPEQTMSARVRDMNQEDGEFIQVPFRRGNAEMSECSTNLRTSSETGPMKIGRSFAPRYNAVN